MNADRQLSERAKASIERVKEWQRRNPLRKAEADRRWSIANKERKAKTWNAYRERNREARNAASRDYYQRNKAVRTEKMRQWRESNPAHMALLGAARRARAKRARPLWANVEVMKEFYVRAADISRVTGNAYHVDHIIPLAGRRVTGLHVEHNLQILPAHENLSKRNGFDEEQCGCP